MIDRSDQSPVSIVVIRGVPFHRHNITPYESMIDFVANESGLRGMQAGATDPRASGGQKSI